MRDRCVSRRCATPGIPPIRSRARNPRSAISRSTPAERHAAYHTHLPVMPGPGSSPGQALGPGTHGLECSGKLKTWMGGTSPAMTRRHLLHTAMVVGPFITVHLFSPVADTMKQLALLPFQVVQKPFLSSFQVPSPLRPAFPSGWRETLPSGVNTIVNLMFEGVDDVNGWPLKKVAWISLGASRPAANPGTTAVARAPAATPAIVARMMFSPGW